MDGWMDILLLLINVLYWAWHKTAVCSNFQYGKAAHLGERKTWFQTSAALNTCTPERLQESTPKNKSRAEVPKAVHCCSQHRSGKSCDTVVAKLNWSCCSFGSITGVDGGDLLLGQQLVYITLPWLAHWRGHSSFALATADTVPAVTAPLPWTGDNQGLNN